MGSCKEPGSRGTRPATPGRPTQTHGDVVIPMLCKTTPRRLEKFRLQKKNDVFFIDCLQGLCILTRPPLLVATQNQKTPCPKKPKNRKRTSSSPSPPINGRPSKSPPSKPIPPRPRSQLSCSSIGLLAKNNPLWQENLPDLQAPQGFTHFEGLFYALMADIQYPTQRTLGRYIIRKDV